MFNDNSSSMPENNFKQSDNISKNNSKCVLKPSSSNNSIRSILKNTDSNHGNDNVSNGKTPSVKKNVTFTQDVKSPNQINNSVVKTRSGRVVKTPVRFQ